MICVCFQTTLSLICEHRSKQGLTCALLVPTATLTIEMSRPLATFLLAERQHVDREDGKKKKQKKKVLGCVMLRYVDLEFPLFCAVSRSQAQQGPEALPEPEVPEVLSGPRAAENHPSQSLPPRCAL